MAIVYYVTCPNCSKQYYLDNLLYEIATTEVQKLKCPFCKAEFYLNKDYDKKGSKT